MEPTLSIYWINLLTVIGMMFVGWIVSIIRKNVTIVDSLWGLGFVIIAGNTFWIGDGFGGRSLLVLVLTAVWGLRLCAYLTWRNWGAGEDHRYGNWREKSGASFGMVSLFKVFLLQAVFLWVISLVLQKTMLSASPVRLTFWDLAGTVVWTAGFLFEAAGDWQLAKFKSDPDNRGRVMDRGLWAWSRHPNYFGEFLVWWGFFLLALATPNGWWTIFSPVIVSAVLLKMTGVPITEKALIKRRPDYRQYIARTSTFFPRPPRKETP